MSEAATKDSANAEAAVPTNWAGAKEHHRDVAIEEITEAHAALIMAVHVMEEAVEGDHYLEISSLKVAERALAAGLQSYMDATRNVVWTAQSRQEAA